MPYKVVLASSFKRCIKKLKKRYPAVKNDTKTAIHQLLETPQAGALIPGGSGVRKLRLRNSDIKKGKSAGYRLIYYLSSNPEPRLYLLLLYTKSDKSDVSAAELRTLLNDLGRDL